MFILAVVEFRVSIVWLSYIYSHLHISVVEPEKNYLFLLRLRFQKVLAPAQNTVLYNGP
jgi:hypothetical protein